MFAKVFKQSFIHLHCHIGHISFPIERWWFLHKKLSYDKEGNGQAGVDDSDDDDDGDVDGDGDVDVDGDDGEQG